MDVGCSLKGSTASTIACWDHFHTYIINDFSKLSQIWGYVCVYNGMNVLSCTHPQLFKVFKHLIYMYDIDMGCSLKGSIASTIAYWDHFHTYIIYDFSKLSQIWENLCGGNGECDAICPSTTVQGVQTPYIYMTWIWDAV